MAVIDCIQAQLERDEGRVLHVYPDSMGWLTIGVGHNLMTKELDQVPPQFRNGITDTQCDALLAADLHHVWDLLDVYVPWWTCPDGANGPRTNVLVNLGFNLGVQKLSGFHQFLGLMRAKDWDGAAADLARTPWYRQVGDRSVRLCKQIVSGEWQ